MKRLAKYLAVLALVSTGTVIYAAPGDPAPPPEAAAKAETQLTVEEMQNQSVAIQARLEADSLHVSRLKDIAKRQKDVIKLTCVNDRIVEIKAQRNIADQANASLQAALSKQGEERHAVYAQLVEIGEAVKLLREKANGCIGEPELFKQESGVEVDRPEIVDDPTQPEDTQGFGDDVEPPGYASAFY